MAFLRSRDFREWSRFRSRVAFSLSSGVASPLRLPLLLLLLLLSSKLLLA